MLFKILRFGIRKSEFNFGFFDLYELDSLFDIFWFSLNRKNRKRKDFEVV